MGFARVGPPKELIYLLRHVGEFPTFVETGTYMAATASWAASIFDEVYTIEREPSLAHAARERLRPFSNVRAVEGDSRAELARIVKSLTGPAIFWLDAHWSGGNTYGEHDQCPTLDELRTIDASAHDHVVLVDDARIFLSPPVRGLDPDQWPTITELLAVMNARPGRYVVVLEDIAIGVPLRYKPYVVPFFQLVADAVQAQWMAKQPA